MQEEKFGSLLDLYKRLLPALKTKKHEMILEKFTQIEEQEIWEFLCETKWQRKQNLTLGEMVDDILNSDNWDIYNNSRKKQKYGTN